LKCPDLTFLKAKPLNKARPNSFKKQNEIIYKQTSKYNSTLPFSSISNNNISTQNKVLEPIHPYLNHRSHQTESSGLNLASHKLNML